METNLVTKTAMVLAAGLGTRLGELTRSRPKALVEVGGRTMLEHVLRRLMEAGYGRFVINIHHFAPMVRSFLAGKGNFGTEIPLSEETPDLLNTGGGILHARPFLEGCGHFLVHNVDIFSNLDIASFSEEASRTEGISSILVSRRVSRSGRYFLFDEDMRLCGWTDEKNGIVRSPIPGFNPQKYRKFAFGGVHMLSSGIFQAFEKAGLEDGTSFSIADFYIDNCDRYPVLGICPENLRLIDAGKVSDLASVEGFIQEA